MKSVFVLDGPTGPTGLFKNVNILSTGPTGIDYGRFPTFAQITGPTGASGPTGTFATVCFAGTGIAGLPTIIIDGYGGGALPPVVLSIDPTGGTTAGGTSVTITGENFTGATAVTIGGSAATGITVVNDTTITATSPAHAAGATDVVVTTPAGSGTGTGLFTYAAPPSTWNSADKTTGSTLTNSDLTFNGGGAGNYGCRGTLSHTTGKYYFEFPTVLFNNNGACGVGNSSYTLNDNSQANSMTVLNWGGIANGGGNMGSVPSGKVVGVAIDLDARLMWFRYDAGNWNASGTANPATGTGGIAITSSVGGATAIFPLAFVQNTGNVTIDTAAPFVNAAPSGFNPWG